MPVFVPGAISVVFVIVRMVAFCSLSLGCCWGCCWCLLLLWFCCFGVLLFGCCCFVVVSPSTPKQNNKKKTLLPQCSLDLLFLVVYLSLIPFVSFFLSFLSRPFFLPFFVSSFLPLLSFWFSCFWSLDYFFYFFFL